MLFTLSPCYFRRVISCYDKLSHFINQCQLGSTSPDMTTEVSRILESPGLHVYPGWAEQRGNYGNLLTYTSDNRLIFWS